MVANESAVLHGPKKPLWGCNCGYAQNWACRIRCKQCDRAAPARICKAARAANAAAGTAAAGKPKPRPIGGSQPRPSSPGLTSEEVQCYAVMDVKTWESVKKYLPLGDRDKVQCARDGKLKQQQSDVREASRIQDKLAGQLQAATKREAKAVEAARCAMLEVARAKAKVAELSQQLADASEKAAAEYAKVAGRDPAPEGDPPLQMAKQLRETLGPHAANDPGAQLLRKLLDKLDPLEAEQPSGVSSMPQQTGGAAGPTKEEVHGDDSPAAADPAGADADMEHAEPDDCFEADQVDAAFDALGVDDMLGKCENGALRKRLQGSIEGLRTQLKRPRRV